MRISPVVVGLVLSVTMFVCVEPALGQRVARPLTAAPEPVEPAPANPLLDALARLDDLEAQVATLQTALATADRQNADLMLANVYLELVDGLKHFSREWG